MNTHLFARVRRPRRSGCYSLSRKNLLKKTPHRGPGAAVTLGVICDHLRLVRPVGIGPGKAMLGVTVDVNFPIDAGIGEAGL